MNLQTLIFQFKRLSLDPIQLNVIFHISLIDSKTNDALYLDRIHSHQTFNHTIFNDVHVITDMQLK